jgi:hypothetical protein
LLKRFFCKGVPVFTPGLLCFIAIIAAPLEGRDFSLAASGGSFLVTPDGASGYRLGGLSYGQGDELSFKVDAGELLFRLPGIHGDITAAAGQFGFQIKNIGLAFSAGFFSHSPFKVDFGETVFNSQGGSGSLLGTALAFRFRGITLEPSVSYASASWREGDFYWFFGKPKLNSFWLLGLRGAYDVHSLNFRFFSLDAGILGNDDISLFNGASEGFFLYYRFSVKNRIVPLSGTLGYFYATAGMDGELTSSNQRYFLFPYRFYNVDTSFSVSAGFAAISLDYGFSIFSIKAALGAVQVFRGSGSADIHYREKALFGGREQTGAVSDGLGGLGAAFLSVDAGLASLRLGTKTKLSLGLKKIFAFPWGYKGLFAVNGGMTSGSGPSGGFDPGLLRTMLLSGFSLYASLGLR